jgi:group II intron reverse transcriptase/maturase
MERAKDSNAKFNSIAHLLDVEALERSFRRIRKDAAVGVDGIGKEDYEQNLEENLRDLQDRMKTRRYRHQPIRRVHIPKAPGKTRPIGVSCIEDKIVQGALREVLEAIYEQDFLSCSYGFRPKRSPHDALRAVDRMVYREKMEWILEADIQAFFDSLVRARLREILRDRVVDGSFLRLVGKCLKVGVLDGEKFFRPEEGTAQGSSISPLLGNIYLHHVLDRWIENEVRPKLSGKARLIRYADDFVIGFEQEDDARNVLAWLAERMAEFGLSLHPDKTRLLFFAPPSGGRKGPTFDFVGFTLHWRKSRRGRWILGMKTRKASLQKALRAISDWCRRHRHWPPKEQHAALVRRLHGHYGYFAINGNTRSLSKMLHQVERIWLKWLRTRSQRGRRLTWERFKRYLKRFPLPGPHVRVRIWASSP